MVEKAPFRDFINKRAPRRHSHITKLGSRTQWGVGSAAMKFGEVSTPLVTWVGDIKLPTSDHVSDIRMST